MLKIQYTGSGRVDFKTGCVELICLTPTGKRVGVGIWNSFAEFFFMDVPNGWTNRHVQQYQKFLEFHHRVRFASEWTIEKRQHMMGYVVDLSNKGFPKKQSVIRMTFRSPADSTYALKTIYGNKWFSESVKLHLLQKQKWLFQSCHIKALIKAKLHMIKKREYPSLWKFQSSYNILPMEWFLCSKSSIQPSFQKDYNCTIRNMDIVRHIALSGLTKIDKMCSEQLTATQTVLAWDIETHSVYTKDEDSFPRPHRAQCHVINIGVNMFKVIGTADTETRTESTSGTVTRHRDVLVLGNTALSTKCNILPYTCEPAMILTFLTNYVARADIVIDYNGRSFDWPYIFNRLLLFEFFGQFPFSEVIDKTLFNAIRLCMLDYKKLVKEVVSMSSTESPSFSKRSSIFDRAKSIIQSVEKMFWNQKLGFLDSSLFPTVQQKKWTKMRKVFTDMDDSKPRLPSPPEYMIKLSNYSNWDNFIDSASQFKKEYDRSQCLQWSTSLHSCIVLKDKKMISAAMYVLPFNQHLTRSVLEYLTVSVDYDLVHSIGCCGSPFMPTYGWFKNVLTTKTTMRSCVDALSRCNLFVLDMCLADCVRGLNLQNYHLETVAKHLKLGGKDDSFGFDYQKMFCMWKSGDPYKRRSIAEYCVVDVDLLYDIFMALQVMQRNTQTAFASRMALIRTCGGMQGKVWPKIFDAGFREKNLLLNYKPHAKKESYEGAIVLDPKSGLYKQWDCDTQEWVSVATLDFASLYPSTIQKDNICYTTFLEDDQVEIAKSCPDLELVGFTDIRDSTKEVYFVQSPSFDDPRSGLLPVLEYDLKKLRDNTRKNRKQLIKQKNSMLADGSILESDPKIIKLTNTINNLEQMQLAIKLIMNSIYGFLGAPGAFAIMPQVHCASAITQSGRRCIKSTKRMCLDMTSERIASQLANNADLMWYLKNGPSRLTDDNIELVYQILKWNPDLKIDCCGGDTDSVFLIFRLKLKCEHPSCGEGRTACRNCYKTLYHKCMWYLGEVISAIATRVLFAGKESMILEMEKYNSIIVIIVKKKYWGLVHTGPTSKGKIGGKGTNVRRGDTIDLVKHVYGKEVCPLLFDPSPEMLDINVKEKVMNVIHAAYEKLRDGGFKPEMFAQRKKLKKPAEQYKRSKKLDGTFCALPQHVQVAKNIFERTGRPVEVGTYVRWIITRSPKTQKRSFVDLDHYLHLVKQQKNEPIDIELYMSRLEIVGELVSSFLQPGVFTQLVKLYQKQYRQRHKKTNTKLLTFLNDRNTKKQQRERLMHTARVNAKKSVSRKNSLRRTKKRKATDKARVQHNLNKKHKHKHYKKKGILRFFNHSFSKEPTE